MKKKFWAVLMSAAVAVTMLVGCSSDTGGAATGESTIESSAEVATEGAAESSAEAVTESTAEITTDRDAEGVVESESVIEETTVVKP